MVRIVAGASCFSQSRSESMYQTHLFSQAHASRPALPFAPSLLIGLAGQHGKADPHPPAGQAKKPPPKPSSPHALSSVLDTANWHGIAPVLRRCCDGVVP